MQMPATTIEMYKDMLDKKEITFLKTGDGVVLHGRAQFWLAERNKDVDAEELEALFKEYGYDVEVLHA